MESSLSNECSKDFGRDYIYTNSKLLGTFDS